MAKTKKKKEAVARGYVVGLYFSVWDNSNAEGKRWRSLETGVRGLDGHFTNKLWFASEVYDANFGDRLTELYGEQKAAEMMKIVAGSKKLAEVLEYATAETSGWL